MIRLDAPRKKSCVTADALPSEADLQLHFARLNYEFFNGEVPDCRIRYNERFSNSAGRTTYGRDPMSIELSPKHFRRHPEALGETLLHEMIHAWCYAKFRTPGTVRDSRKSFESAAWVRFITSSGMSRR